MPRFIDLTGHKFTRLVVLHRVRNHGRRVAFLCQCACGNTKICVAQLLQCGDTQSCGCLPHATPLHGSSRTVEYSTWRDMHQRCYNPKNAAYHNYGARGIFVVQRWHTAIHFLVDMGPRPSPHHTLERRNNDGPYSPENCYWATRKQQARNRRNTKLVTYQGEARLLTDWCKAYQQNISTVLRRLNVLHWDIHDALTIPPNSNANRKRF